MSSGKTLQMNKLQTINFFSQPKLGKINLEKLITLSQEMESKLVQLETEIYEAWARAQNNFL